MEWIIFGIICIVLVVALWKGVYDKGYHDGHSMGLIDGRIEEVKRRADKPRVMFWSSEDWAMKRAVMYTLSSAITVRKVEGLEYPWYLMDENGRVMATDGTWIVPNFDAMPKVQR